MSHCSTTTTFRDRWDFDVVVVVVSIIVLGKRTMIHSTTEEKAPEDRFLGWFVIDNGGGR